MSLPELKNHTSQDFYHDAKNRIPNQKQKIISALRKAGRNGLTNLELKEQVYALTARMSELYAEGYSIAVENLGNGVSKYILVSEPRVKIPKQKSAFHILMSEVKKTGFVNAEQLKVLLHSHNFNVVRSHGSVKPIINIAGR